MHRLTVQGLTRAPWFRAFGLEVEAGEIVVIRGASGSGKTLLLRTLADLDPADAGVVQLDGEVRESLAPSLWRSRVLYVHPEGARLTGTVGEGMERIGRLAVRRGAAREAVRAGVSLAAAADRLSSGEAQDVALTRALACDPELLLLDEPTSSMDEERARRWEARLLAWVAGERGILWISHEEALAARLGARTVRFP